MTVKSIQSVRGMHDCLPNDAIMWNHVETKIKSVLNSYGYNEIRLPIIESTDLFKRSIGEITDVVEKEMYSFCDKNGNDLTLRPEGTSGCVRSVIEHSLLYNNVQRLWYLGPMFRRERPQKGRYRQFHQFSAEAFGFVGPDIDAELILISVRCWKALGISQFLSLELNSIGLLSSRTEYRKKLVDFLEKNMKNLDSNSKLRLYSNPMKILDTKNVNTKNILKDAPVLQDYLDSSSRAHFSNLCKLLDSFGISYTINPYLVRGLDYYNRTVFEWVTYALGQKKTVCAGGRYDDLAKQLGGKVEIPAIGFAIGLERVLLLMKMINVSSMIQNSCINIYVISVDLQSQKCAVLLSEYFRDICPSLRLIVNYGGDGLKRQLSRANKNKARFVLIVNAKEYYKKKVILKDLQTGQQNLLKHSEIISRLY